MRKRRVRAALTGTAAKPRLSVFRSNRAVYAQLIDDKRGVTLAAAAAATGAETGKIIGEQAKKVGIAAAVFDRGPYRYHGHVRAVAEFLRRAGVQL